MKITDVKRIDPTLPCEICMKLATFELEYRNFNQKYYVYICDKHLNQSALNVAIELVKDRSEEKQMKIYKRVYKNVSFKFYYQTKLDIIHILDCRGNDSFRTLKAGIDEILPYIEKETGRQVNKHTKIYLYCSDLTVSEYKRNSNDVKFKLLRSQSTFLYIPFMKEMKMLYN